MEGRTLMFSGKRLRKARVRKGWTQDQLSRAIGVRERNIIRWENSQNVPRAETVAALAQATGHSIEFFYVATGADEDDEEAALRRRARAFLEAMDDDMVVALHREAAMKVAGRAAR